MSLEDALTHAHRLEQLRDEHTTISVRMQEIRQEAHGILSRIEAEFNPEPPTNPRPLEDKLSISLGRTLVLGVKSRWGMAHTKKVALEKALRIARRNGVETLPPAFIKRVDAYVYSAFKDAEVEAEIRHKEFMRTHSASKSE